MFANEYSISTLLDLRESLCNAWLHNWFISAPLVCRLIPQETAMQVFQCHYREGSLVSGLYFDHIKDVLHAASQGTSGFSCKPPPCINPQNPPGTRHSFALFFVCVCLFFDGYPEEERGLAACLLVQIHWFGFRPLGMGIRYMNAQPMQVIKEAAWLKGALKACLIHEAHLASRRGKHWLGLREATWAWNRKFFSSSAYIEWVGMPAIIFLEV